MTSSRDNELRMLIIDESLNSFTHLQNNINTGK